MATVFERDGVWIAKWRDAAGRWRQKRTSCVTKSEARRFAEDLERKGERQREGLEPLPSNAPPMTFAALLDWWWEEYGQRLRGRDLRRFADKHLRAPMGNLTLREVSTSQIEGLLQRESRDLAPKSLNHIRGLFHRIFALAIKREKWVGPNPAASVERRKSPKRLPQYLRLEEVPRLLNALTPKWRPLFATAIFTGMRQGELLGLKKNCVDLQANTVEVSASYDAPTTKGGHADLLPIAQLLRPFLVDAMKRSPSDLVFPRPDGTMHSPELKLDHVLRRALGRAGIVTGYIHKCRRHHCGYEVKASTSECGRCPKCNMRLWAKAIPRHVRFHDMRHTTATLLLKEGVPLATVQRVLRHTDPRLTTEIYGHLDVEDMRAGLDRLRIATTSAPPQVPAGVQDSNKVIQLFSPNGAPVVRGGASSEKTSPVPSSNAKEDRALRKSGRQDSNLRPPGPEPGALPG